MSAPTPRPAPPSATYRVPLGDGQHLADVAGLVPRLAETGHTHLSLPSVLRSRPGGSRNAVVDYTEVDPVIGGEGALRDLAEQAHAAGLGVVADLPASHLAVGPTTPLWERLLAEGRSSQVASAFDVDWEPPLPGAEDKVIVPALQESYGEALVGGLLGLQADADGVRVTYRDTSFPVNGEVAAALERSGLDGVAGVPGEERSWQRMHSLLERQHYRLVSTAAGARLVNVRLVPGRPGLTVALRLEEGWVAEHAHGLASRLVRDGVLDGLRVVDVDGLSDPAAYLGGLREAVGDAWLVVDAPRGPDDPLPPEWPVDGAGGHGLLRVALGVHVDREGWGVLADVADRVGGRPAPAEVRQMRRDVLDAELAPDLRRAARVLWAACQEETAVRDVDYRTLLEAVSRLATSTGPARLHVDPATGRARTADVRAVDAMVTAAQADEDGHPIPDRLWVHLRQVLAGEVRWSGTVGEAVTRFQQITGPVARMGGARLRASHQVMAGGDEVGCDPEALPRTLEQAHAELRSLPPAGLRTTAPPGAELDEDVRLRITALTGVASEWARLAGTVLAGSPPPDPALGLRMLQVVVGTWPILDDGQVELTTLVPTDWADRLADHAVGLARTAGRGTSWRHPATAVEQGLADWTRRLVDPTGATARMIRPLARRAAEIGMAASLSQTLLRATASGVSDTLAGTEGWGSGGPGPVATVDLATLADGPAATEPGQAATLWARRRDGRVKGHVLRHALQARRRDPAVWRDAGHHPIGSAGRWAEHMLVLGRGEDGAAPAAVVVAPRVFGRVSDGGRFSPVGRIWADTDLLLPDGGPWTDALTGATVSGGHVPAAEVLATLPVALLLPSD